MSSNPLRLKRLLEKYFNNDCTSSELEEFWQLMASLSENDLIFHEVKELWHSTYPPDAARDVQWDNIYGRIRRKMDVNHLPESYYLHKAQTGRRNFFIAASVMAVLIVGGWFLQSNFSVKKRVEKNTSTSQTHQVIILPDGTRVTLNTESKLNYPAVFNGGTRDVYLTGEAYFDVKHDSAKPFIVHSGLYETIVLGTAFNIKAYPNDSDMAVTVTRGKVKVENTENKQSLGILLPGDQLVIHKISVSSKIGKIDVKKALEWKKEDLVFDNITFNEAAVLISNYYGVELLFANDKLRHCRFTGNFSNGESLEETLDIICTLTKASWVKENKTVIRILGVGCD